MASRTASAPWPASGGPFLMRTSPCPSIGGRCSSMVNRVVRSTSVPMAVLLSPMMLGRAGAPCQPLSWWVSPARPPNRTCGSHRIRLSTGSCRWCGCSSRRSARPWCGDVGMPVAVSSDRHRSWPEHCHTVLADLPVREVATADRSQVRLWVSFADPADDPPPGVCVDVTEGPFGHPVAKVVTPAPQHRIHLAPVSYTHLRAHETGRNLVCRLLLEK